MEFLFFSQSYNRYGGSTTFTPIANLLTVRLHGRKYGAAIKEIHFDVALRSKTRKLHRTQKEMFDEFHESLTRFPKVTFYRQRRRIEVRFVSDYFCADDDESSKLRIESCQAAAEEVAVALQLLKTRIKRSDDFDLSRFLADAQEAMTTPVGNLKAWQQIQAEAERMELDARSRKDPWELLDIDWSEFHQQAREVLDEPFYWQCANDIAPHGNDTGADLLHDYCQWFKRNSEKSPLVFLRKIFAEWEIEPIDWTLTDPQRVAQLAREHSISLTTCNEAAIALAFAEFKVKGSCPPEVAELAQRALTRTSQQIEASRLDEDLKKQWREGIAKMQRKLRS